MAQLRNPAGGCPWDLAQDFSTIAPYTIEEAYEVADAIDRGDMAELKDELGDLLLQVVFHARMAEEAGLFDFDDVARAINDKMLRRHPHVFDETARLRPRPAARRRPTPGDARSSCSTGSTQAGRAPCARAATPARWPASRAACRNGSAR
jgi:NTP pyrophosphatase (non-canonical NTP hydrolase)